jgi:hypothetical protein
MTCTLPLAAASQEGSMTVLYDVDAILALRFEYKSEPLAGRPVQLRFHAWKNGRRVVG